LTCEYDHKSATCGDRIKFASGSYMPGKPDPVKAAQELVASQCEMCRACTPEEFDYQYGLVFRKYEASDGVFFRRGQTSQVSFAKLCSGIASMLLVGGFVVAGIRHRRSHVQVDTQRLVEE